MREAEHRRSIAAGLIRTAGEPGPGSSVGRSANPAGSEDDALCAGTRCLAGRDAFHGFIAWLPSASVFHLNLRGAP